MPCPQNLPSSPVVTDCSPRKGRSSHISHCCHLSFRDNQNPCSAATSIFGGMLPHHLRYSRPSSAIRLFLLAS
ncbi:hypothetical protein L1887_27754 [Cichorium endivia]|nr:hypothetical protein L1887_27754 [Cichorium endivia]